MHAGAAALGDATNRPPQGARSRRWGAKRAGGTPSPSELSQLHMLRLWLLRLQAGSDGQRCLNAASLAVGEVAVKDGRGQWRAVGKTLLVVAGGDEVAPRPECAQESVTEGGSSGGDGGMVDLPIQRRMGLSGAAAHPSHPDAAGVGAGVGACDLYQRRMRNQQRLAELHEAKRELASLLTTDCRRAHVAAADVNC